MNQEQTNITTGKQIRHLRTQLGMTQEELAGELNVTRQALSNWERDVNEPDLNMLKKICFLFGVNMDDFAKEVITKMETYEKKEKRQFNKYDMAIGLFYGVGIFLGIGIFFVGGFMTMSGAGWGASLFGGGCFSLVFGLICHAVTRLAARPGRGGRIGVAPAAHADTQLSEQPYGRAGAGVILRARGGARQAVRLPHRA